MMWTFAVGRAPASEFQTGIASWCFLAARTTDQQRLRVRAVSNDINTVFRLLVTREYCRIPVSSKTLQEKHTHFSSLLSLSCILTITIVGPPIRPIPVPHSRSTFFNAASCHPCGSSLQAPVIECTTTAPHRPRPAQRHTVPPELCSRNETSHSLFLNAIASSFAPGRQRLKGTVPASRHVPG